MRFIHLPLCVALLTLCGCEKDAKSSEAKEERDPLIKQGQAYMEIREYAKAEDAFKQALENNPRMARPHLDLATIYHQYKTNYIHSIYHYDRYLELRPTSEKAEFIREQIGKVHNALYSGILTQSGAFQLKQEYDLLQKENMELKRRLAAQPKASAQTAPAKSVTQTVPKSAKPPASTQTTHQIYTVVAGDNLTKIAKKFYGDDDYDAIYEANKDRMKSPGDLRVGQTLVIPNR
jgi:tetratricopeptide (TPR) repeat protein